MKPIICELGMGVDVHGHDYTKAALRGVSDAIRHSSLTIFYNYKEPNLMHIEVTIGVPEPTKVDKAAVKAAIPYGSVDVKVVQGGLNDKGMGGKEDITLAAVAVKAWLNTEDHKFKIKK